MANQVAFDVELPAGATTTIRGREYVPITDYLRLDGQLQRLLSAARDAEIVLPDTGLSGQIKLALQAAITGIESEQK